LKLLAGNFSHHNLPHDGESLPNRASIFNIYPNKKIGVISSLKNAKRSTRKVQLRER
jgi:hypothetical protein